MLNISGIQEGFVLDHIQAGMSLQIYHDLKLDQLDCTVAIIKNAKSNKMGKKDILKVECPVAALDLDILGFIDHNITVNIIRDGEIVAKKCHQGFQDCREKGTSHAKTGKECHPLQKPTMHHFHRAGTRPDLPSHR